ncbi:MAG: cysteine desulfurase [Colwellia sp.]|uniref:cysteine desulfurase family protein n=1 Tax=Colwellia sp. TaxID=56799 RepID=UPI001DDD0C3B|nr:cysteine desulfurase family protein [Colwellia sp.]NQY49327.1 cysteine desulfurase [Colwellia sp.]
MDQQHISGYFDYNATTPICSDVIDSMVPAMKLFANPSGNNRHSQTIKKTINEARQNVAQLLQTQVSNIFFTSGGSEANNWAIKGVLFKHIDKPGHIITTEIEHASVLDTVKYFADTFGFEVTYLKPKKDGAIDVSDLENALQDNTQLITIMYANNETGVIQSIEKMATITSARKIPFHVDAVQLVGKRKINVEKLGIDYLSLSAHKFYGPKGVGSLYIKDIDSIEPLIHGGGQEFSMRAGTENLVTIVGLSKAAQRVTESVEQWDSDNWQCKQHLVALLEASPLKIKFNGSTDYSNSLSNTLNIAIDGIRGESLMLQMELIYGFIISVGSACSNNKTINLSHVLQAMNINETDIQSSIRISFGRFTQLEDIEKFVTALVSAVEQLLAISTGY